MKKLALVGVIAVSALFAGCASPALTENMVVPAEKVATYSFDANLKKSVAVSNVQAFAKYENFVTSDGFKQALSNSLDNAGLLASTGNKYKIDAVMSNVELPAFAMDMKATITVDYVLSDLSGKEVLKKTVVSVGVATAGEAFAGTKRLQMAIERSVQDNIGNFINELAAVKL